MVIINAKIKVFDNTASIYEGQPPENLNINLFYNDEPAKFKIISSVSLTGTDNKVTIVGELDESPVTEIITCTGLSTEGDSFFDVLESLAFSFATTTNVKISGITENGDDNKVMSIVWENVEARVRELKWTRDLAERGIMFDKSRMAYLPLFITLNNSHIIEYLDQNYTIVSIVRGITGQEVLITRLDE